MHIRTLGRTGIKVFSVGVGTAGLGIHRAEDFFRVYVEKNTDLVDRELGKQALVSVLAGMMVKAGKQRFEKKDVRILVDTAAFYEGRESERMIGEVLSEFPVFRKLTLVTTKVGQTLHGGVNYDPAHIRDSLQESAELLGVNVFELVYLHDPMGLPEDTVFKAREAVLESGLAEFVGIAANDPDTNEKFIASGLFPAAVVPGAVSLINTKIEQGILTYAARHNVGLVAATVIERGLLLDNPLPLDKMGGRTFSAECVEYAEKMRVFCHEKGFSLSAAAIQWPVWRYPEIAVSIVGIQTKEHAWDLTRVAGASIPEDFFLELQGLVKHFDAVRI